MHISKIILISLLLIFLLIVQGVGATTYYVAKTGNDDNVGSEGSPWLTIQKAASTVTAGDTVYVKAGTYIEQVIFNSSNSGTAEDYITFQNYSTDVVIIKAPIGKYQSRWGMHSGTFQFFDNNLSTNPAHHIIIKGFNITTFGGNARANNGTGYRNSPEGVFSIENGAHDIIIEGNILYDIDNMAIAAGYFWNGSTNYWNGETYAAYNISFINNYVYRPTAWNWEELLSFATVNNANVSYNTIAYQGHGECIDFKQGTHNSIISYNNISNCFFGKTANAGWRNNKSQGIYIDGYQLGANNIKVFGNILNNTSGIDFGSEEGGLNQNSVIYNNIIYNSFRGIYLQEDTAPHSFNNITIMNNVVYATDVAGKNGMVYSSDVSYKASYSSGMDNITFKNNINYSTSPININTKHKQYNNSWNLGITEPEFVDAPHHNFHLKSTSPAIDAGNSIGFPSVDYDGVSRPQGAGVDIGAYEYTSVPPINNPVPPPVNISTPTITSYSTSKSNDNSTSITINKSESITFDFTANQAVTGVWTKDGTIVSSTTTSFTTSWLTTGSKTVTGRGININGTTSTIIWTIQVLPEEDNPSKIGIGGSTWSDHSTMDNLYADDQIVKPGIYRDNFDDGTYDLDVEWGNISVSDGKLHAYGTYASLYKNIGNQTDIATFIQINETNATAMRIFGSRSDTSREAFDFAYLTVLKSNGIAEIQTINKTNTIIINSSTFTRTDNVGSSYVFKTCGTNQKLYASNTNSYSTTLNNLFLTGSDSLYSYGNKIYIQMHVYNSTQSNTLDDIRVLKTDASCNILHSGNLTAHYTAESNNIIDSIIVNASNDADYTLEYRQYPTNNTWILLGTNLSGNQTKSTIYGSKYQQTEVRITSYFNDTSSPEIQTIEFITGAADRNTYPRYDVDGNGIIDDNDLILISQHFNEVVYVPYPQYDVNMDGLVNIDDITIVGQHFGEKF